MLDKIKHINPDQLTNVEELRSVVLLLLNLIEDQAKRIETLEQEVRGLKDENAKLKGGNARPQIKASVKEKVNISSGGKEKGSKNHKQYEAKAPLVIDRDIVVEVNAELLPADAVRKGYSEYIQQDLVILRDNKRFLFANWYSPSLKKTISADFPAGQVDGHFGAGVRSLINILHHLGNVTEGTMALLLKSFGVQISTGTISNVLKAEHGWAVEEERAILQAALHRVEPKQMDSTGNVQKGVNKTTHIIASSFFTVFYTLKGKSRLDCLRALQGNPAEGLQLLWHGGIDTDFKAAGVGFADRTVVNRLMAAKPAVSWSEFDELMQRDAPKIFAKPKIMQLLREAMALVYYAHQTDFPALQVLLSDNAPEYNNLALFRALCWVHDARYYNKLHPQIAVHEKILEDFQSRYWDFYDKLLDFKEQPPKKQKIQKNLLRAQFDQIFAPNTKYDALNLAIERTKANKAELLRVLEFPALPLHNNAAELAARRVVRKRDISLHTWSDWGTQLRDAFMSIIETAIKLGISPFDFIHDRITKQYKMPSLATVIYPSISQTF